MRNPIPLPVRHTHWIGVEVRSHGVLSNVMSAVPTQSLQGSMMQQMGMMSLSDAVKHFTGINVRDYGGIGGMKQ